MESGNRSTIPPLRTKKKSTQKLGTSQRISYRKLVADLGFRDLFIARQGEAAAEAAHQATLGRLRGRVTDTLATKTTKPKPDPPAPNFMFYPAMKAMPGGARSVPAEPMITLLRLLRSITDSLKAVVKKDKVMHVL